MRPSPLASHPPAPRPLDTPGSNPLPLRKSGNASAGSRDEFEPPAKCLPVPHLRISSRQVRAILRPLSTGDSSTRRSFPEGRCCPHLLGTSDSFKAHSKNAYCLTSGKATQTFIADSCPPT